MFILYCRIIHFVDLEVVTNSQNRKQFFTEIVITFTNIRKIRSQTIQNTLNLHMCIIVLGTEIGPGKLDTIFINPLSARAFFLGFFSKNIENLTL